FRTMTSGSITEFKNNYANMIESRKWKLNCSQRFVENSLYEYGMKLKKESCVHSFILDVDNEDFRGLFEDDGWEEIECTNIKEGPPLPNNVDRLLHDFNKDSSRRYEDFNTRTIFYAVIYSMYVTQIYDGCRLTLFFFLCTYRLFLLEASPNPLMSQQLEQWYQTNVWTPVTDKMLGNLPSVVCVLGESASVASKERKRQQGKLYPRRMGSRTDMVLRKTGNGIALEYGT
ncbi:uncharacterized protein BX664DRAFT_270964, partial [Halteromyces radiatus]|uniref:uncharacterized protein n=1 Tax=Halteromyces radiatus TaxID=101107 RepID=UPI00221E3DAA